MATQNTTWSYPEDWEFYDPNKGWYNPPSCGGSDYASVMHNKWGYPTDIEKDAITKDSKLYDSKEDMDNSLYNYIHTYFGDRIKNEREGLAIQYIKFKIHVIDNKVIGAILWGADINNINRSISKYTTSSNTEITLIAHIICQTLINEYIKPENVDRLCEISLE